jgi:hypothetical protein
MNALRGKDAHGDQGNLFQYCWCSQYVAAVVHAHVVGASHTNIMRSQQCMHSLNDSAQPCTADLQGLHEFAMCLEVH